MKPNIRSIKEKDRPLIDDLDTVPFPDRDLINASDYTGIALRKGIPDTEVGQSRTFNLCAKCRLKHGIWYEKQAEALLS